MLLTHTKRGRQESRVLPDARQRSAFYTQMNSPTAQETAENITYTPYGTVTTDGDVDQSPRGIGGGLDTSQEVPEGRAANGVAASQPIQWSSEFNDTELALIYYKTPAGCKGGWTCAEHAPRRGEATRRCRRINYRYYNPQDGRWTRRDPIGIEGSVNLYTYVRNNSLLLFDYLGSYVTTLEELGPYELEIAGREAIRRAIAAVIQMAEAQALNSLKRCKNCKPCIPEVGTLMYRIDMEGRTRFCKSTNTCADKGHTHYFIVQQTPYPKCKCIAPELREYAVPGKHAQGSPYMKPTGGGPAL